MATRTRKPTDEQPDVVETPDEQPDDEQPEAPEEQNDDALLDPDASEQPDVVETPVARATGFEPDQWVKENYAQLREERGWTWEQLADNLKPTDPSLAAYLRNHGTELDEKPRGAGRAPQETR